MATKLGNMVAYLDGLLPIELFDNKLDKVLTHRAKLSSLKQHDPLIMWSIWGHIEIWKIHVYINITHWKYWPFL